MVDLRIELSKARAAFRRADRGQISYQKRDAIKQYCTAIVVMMKQHRLLTGPNGKQAGDQTSNVVGITGDG